jgi:hypothetical protein
MDMQYLGICVHRHILVIHAWLFILYLLVYIVEGYIICLIINYMYITNYTVSSSNMTWYRRTIPLWLKSVNFCDISWILLVSNTPSCIKCLSLFYFSPVFNVTVTVSWFTCLKCIYNIIILTLCNPFVPVSNTLTLSVCYILPARLLSYSYSITSSLIIRNKSTYKPYKWLKYV